MQKLAYRTPDWEDFVGLAVTEIRQFGGTSIQVVRRLRAMLENLIEVLPPERVVLLQAELLLPPRQSRWISPRISRPTPAVSRVLDFPELCGIQG